MALPKESVLIAALFAAVGSGAVGGLLFAFSNFVMKALSLQPPASGIRTMQAINVQIINPLFMLLFLGTAVASAALAVVALLDLSRPGATFLLVGCALYLIGVFGVTVAFNVPLNNVLAAYDPASVEAAQYWPTYVARWLLWNHIRTLAAFAASACLIVAIREL